MGVEILQGDARTVLAGLPARSVHCCITSPPYFNLRDYGTAAWEGGDGACDHMRLVEAPRSGRAQHLVDGNRRNAFGGPTDIAQTDGRGRYRGTCGRCGAQRVDHQLGAEQTPQEYVAALVEVFRGVWRVLRDDGTLWLVLGDSYANRGNANPTMHHSTLRPYGGKRAHEKSQHRPQPVKDIPVGLCAKSLLGIPWRVAFALQDDGWILRQELIWHKPNPMPESVKDRCTRGHETIFMLAKQERYYYDQEAIREPATMLPQRRLTQRHSARDAAMRPDRKFLYALRDEPAQEGHPSGRNKRSVWTIGTQPLGEDHYAAFPEKLVVPMALAGCPAGGTVLDPFCGSGTALLVAKKLGRSAVGIDINPAYVALAHKRVDSTPDTLFGARAATAGDEEGGRGGGAMTHDMFLQLGSETSAR